MTRSNNMKPDLSLGRPTCDVLVHGSGECDQLGLGEGVLERKKPTILKALLDKKIVSIAVGSLHNLALTADGHVYSWGCNDDGALGRTGEENIPLPVAALQDVPIRKISVGDCHSAFLDYAGRLWICGTYKDSSGHLGFPDYEKGIGHVHHKQIEPVLVHGLPQKTRVEDVVCGANHTVVILSSTDSRRRSSTSAASLRIMAWGNDEFGQLGLGSARDEEEGRPEEDTVMLRHTSRGKRNLKTKLFPRDVVWNIRSGGGVRSIFASAQTTFIKTADNGIYGCGLNNFGQIGFGNTSPYPIRTLTKVEPLSNMGSPVEFIAGGTVHSAARLHNGKVVSWGRRDYSGLPPSKEGDIQRPAVIPSLSGVTYIACGGSHTLASTKGGKAYAWGFGGTHQLGNLPRDISMGAAAPDEEPEDEQEPYLIDSKQLSERFVVSVAAGAQHSVELTFNGQYAEDMSRILADRAAAVTPSKRKSAPHVGSGKKRRTESS
jgi:regulator of chromosome condensation